MLNKDDRIDFQLIGILRSREKSVSEGGEDKPKIWKIGLILGSDGSRPFDASNKITNM